MVFWIVTAAVALLLTALLVLALMRGRRETGPAEAFDLDVYRDQLREVDAEAARGKIEPEEAERLRVEISRRVLAADVKSQETLEDARQPQAAGVAAAVVVAVLVLGGGFGLYLTLGQPGYRDLPREARIAMAAERLMERPSQAEAEAALPAFAPPPDAPPDYMTLVERLRAAVEERPDDLRGQQLLARTEAALGNYAAAHVAQSEIVRLKGDAATAQDWADLADMLVLAADGYVSPQAQEALEQALQRDPSNGVARYYGGLMMAQTGRPDIGFQMWNRLLNESRPDAPWVPPIRAQIEFLAVEAGQNRFTLPEMEQAPGPTEDDIAAAAQMSPEDRMQMIRGMVGQLSDRLANSGGPPEDWARLVSALGVLGDTEQAGAIWTEAQTVFAEDPEALAMVRNAAEQAGVLE